MITKSGVIVWREAPHEKGGGRRGDIGNKRQTQEKSGALFTISLFSFLFCFFT